MSDLWSPKQIENFEYFEENLGKFLSDSLLSGKFIIIHDRKIFNPFDSFENALIESEAKLPKNEFIIQQVISPSDTIGFLYSAINAA